MAFGNILTVFNEATLVAGVVSNILDNNGMQFNRQESTYYMQSTDAISVQNTVDDLDTANVNYTLYYVNDVTGDDLFTHGLLKSDRDAIRQLLLL